MVLRSMTHAGCDHDHGAGPAGVGGAAAAALAAMRSGTATRGSASRGLLSGSGRSSAWSISSLPRLLSHFASVASGSFRGKILLTVWSSFLIGLYTFTKRRRNRKMKNSTSVEKVASQHHKHRQDKDAITGGLQKKESAFQTNLSQIFSFAWTSVRPHAFGIFGAKVATYVFLLAYRIRVTVKIATLTSKLGSYFGTKRWDKMFDGQVTFGLWCIVAAATTAAMKYMEKVVAIDFRSILYQKLHKCYFGDAAIPSGKTAPNTIYALGSVCQDASARLTSDLHQFSNLMAHELGHTLKPCIDVAYLATDLSSQIGIVPLSFFLLFFYWSKSALSRASTLFPQPLSALVREEQRLEAELYSQHQHVHNFREEICLSRGQYMEGVRAKNLYSRLEQVCKRRSMLECVMDGLRSYIIKYGGAMCAFSMLIPAAYLGGHDCHDHHHDHSSHAHSTPDLSSYEDGTANYLMRSTLLMTLANAVKDLADSVNCLNELLGIGSRVIRLSDLIRSNPSVSPHQGRKNGNDAYRVQRDSTAQSLVLNGLSVSAPQKQEGSKGRGEKSKRGVLIHQISMDVPIGEHVAISGPNGTGKSSLFRTLGGLWSAHEGTAMVPASLYVMPQRSHFVFQGSLLEQVCYPLCEHISLPNVRVEAEQLLRDVGLEDVMMSRGLDCSDDFSGEFSFASF